MECIVDLTSDLSCSVIDIDPESNLLLLYRRPSSVGILNWKTKEWTSMQMETHPGESVWSYTISQRLASFISHEQSPNIIACRLCGPYVLFFTGPTIEAHPLSWLMPPTPSASLRPILRRILSDQFLRVDVSSVQTSQYSSNQTYTVFVLICTVAHDPFLRIVIDLEDAPVTER